MTVTADSATDNGPQPLSRTSSETPAPSRAVFVVGPGRSGTSTITRGLQALGVDLGNEFKAANRKNPTGFFEDRELLAVGKQARAVLGLKPESVALVAAEDWDRPELERLRTRAVAIVAERFGKCPLWGFKYAQTLRYLPFWLSVLARAGVQVDFVVAIRNPLAVARSRAKLDRLRGRQEKSDLEWLVNVVPYFRALARHRFVVVDYDLLMAEPRAQLARMGERLGIAQTQDCQARIEVFAGEFLDPGLHRNRVDTTELDWSAEINPLTRDTYRWLRRLASDEMGADEAEFWARWGQFERDLVLLGPVLRHLDYLEHRLRWATNPFREALRQLKREWHARRWQGVLGRKCGAGMPAP